MSVTQSWFGSDLAKARSTRSRAMLSGLLCRHFGRPVTPVILARRISISTAPWPTLIPWPSARSGGPGGSGRSATRVESPLPRAHGCATGSSPTRRPPRPGPRPAQPGPRQPLLRPPRTASWVVAVTGVFQQLDRATGYLQFGFHVVDALFRRGQLSLLRACQTWDQPLIDAVLTPPHGDRLLTDPQVACHLSDAATRLNKIDNPATELRRVTPSAHTGLLVSAHQNPAIRLRESRDTPAPLGLIGREVWTRR